MYDPETSYWGRWYSLDVITNNETINIATKTTLTDTTGLQFEFRTQAYTTGSAKFCHCRIYNCELSTFNIIAGQNNPNNASQLVITAGYIAQHGIVFSGQIIQQKMGRLDDGVTTYVDLIASDGDLYFSQGYVGVTVAAGSSSLNRLTTIAHAVGLTLNPSDFIVDTSTAYGVILPYGRTFHGKAIDLIRKESQNIGARPIIENNNLLILGEYNTRNGQTIIINSNSGLIKTPVQTIEGIAFDCLLNSKIIQGCAVQINESDIQPINYPFFEAGGILDPTSTQLIPSILKGDATYKVLYCSHSGNTRGNEWQTHVVCYGNPNLVPSQYKYLGALQL
jgi:hypothetical protein